MAASGLNQAIRDRNNTPKDHLYSLMDFCIAVLQTVQNFNEGMYIYVWYVSGVTYKYNYRGKNLHMWKNI